MSKRCKVRSKRNLAFAIIAIVFIITIKVNAKQKHNSLQFLSYSTIVDTPPQTKRSKNADCLDILL